MEATPLEQLVSRGRTSLRQRLGRWRSKGYQIAQCAVAAGVAWFVAADLIGHQSPFFAPIAAVVSLGTSYSQRLRRVAEVTIGVAIGVFVGDLLVVQLGQGWWTFALVVALGMSVAFLLDGGQVFVIQAAVQGIVIAGILPQPGQAVVRWTDALIGGAVALVAATVVPAAPLRRPREQAALIVDKIAALVRAAGEVMTHGEVEPALDLLADARSTDHLVRELQSAADEGMSVVASSPFRVRHRGEMRRMSELVDPLDRALRSTRVMVRQTAVAAYHRRPVPAAYAQLCAELAAAVEVVREELAANRLAVAARGPLLEVAEATGMVERSQMLSAEVILAQVRAVVVDLLLLTGMGPMEATDALPPPPTGRPG